MVDSIDDILKEAKELMSLNLQGGVIHEMNILHKHTDIDFYKAREEALNEYVSALNGIQDKIYFERPYNVSIKYK